MLPSAGGERNSRWDGAHIAEFRAKCSLEYATVILTPVHTQKPLSEGIDTLRWQHIRGPCIDLSTAHSRVSRQQSSHETTAIQHRRAIETAPVPGQVYTGKIFRRTRTDRRDMLVNNVDTPLYDCAPERPRLVSSSSSERTGRKEKAKATVGAVAVIHHLRKTSPKNDGRDVAGPFCGFNASEFNSDRDVV